MIKKIWTDPVWSKVIAVGIVAIITLIYTKFFSFTENVTFEEAFDKIFEIKVKVVYIIDTLIIYWIFTWFFKKIFKKESGFYNVKQQKLRTFNKITDPKTGILYKWQVFFRYEIPFISDLTAFCTKHGEIPIRFIGEGCPIQDCENSGQKIDKFVIKNYIESDLIDKWEKIK